MELLYGQDKAVAEWVFQRIPYLTNIWTNYVAIGVLDNGNLIAGFIYHDYFEGNIQFSMASSTPRWCTRKTLRVLFAYPFVQCGVRRVSFLTAKKNYKARRALQGMGFKLEGKLRNYYYDDDCLIYGLLRKEADKWILTKK